MKKYQFIALFAALAITVAACTPQQQQEVADIIADDSITVNLVAQNNSGKSGTAILKSEGDDTVVVVEVSNSISPPAQPAHIHMNSCANIGGIKYSLTPLIDGKSETILPVKLSDLTDKEQLSINIHESVAAISNYIACGDLPFNSMMEDDEVMIEDDSMGHDDTMMEDDKMKDDSMMEDDKMIEDDKMEDDSAMMEEVSFTGTVLAGNQAKLLEFNQSDYDKALKANKVVVLYFYANWCPSCKKEFPKMETAFDQLTSDDVVGFRVNFNDNETTDAEKALAREFGVGYQHTKVILQNGERVLKAPDSWDTNRYLSEINKVIN